MKIRSKLHHKINKITTFKNLVMSKYTFHTELHNKLILNFRYNIAHGQTQIDKTWHGLLVSVQNFNNMEQRNHRRTGFNKMIQKLFQIDCSMPKLRQRLKNSASKLPINYPTIRIAQTWYASIRRVLHCRGSVSKNRQSNLALCPQCTWGIGGPITLWHN